MLSLLRTHGEGGAQHPHCLQTHSHHQPDQPDDVLLIIRPIRVRANAAVLVFLDLILVDDPVQGAAVRPNNGKVEILDC